MGQHARWTLPQIIDPLDSLCFQIHVPNERFHIAAFYGAIFNLAKPYNWQNDPLHTAIAVGEVWGKIFDDLINQQCPIPTTRLRGEMADLMSGLRVDCDCNLWVTCCDGTEKQILTSDQVKKLIAGQPGSGSPQPLPGACAQYPITLNANSQWLLPTFVSTGDTIELQNFAGAGNDGIETHWRCPDGEQFFAGACVGFSYLDGGDPLPTSNHMSIIAKIGAVFYPIIGGIFTVPVGHANDQVILQVNDAALADNSGQYSGIAQVCRAATAGWSHTFDFSLNGGGFVDDPTGLLGPMGIWTAGTGWTNTDGGNAGGDYYRGMAIKKTFAAIDIDHGSLNFSGVLGRFDFPAEYGLLVQLYNGSMHTVISFPGSAYNPSVPPTQSWAGSLAGVTEIYIVFFISETNTSPANLTSSNIISALTVGNAVGSDPF